MKGFVLSFAAILPFLAACGQGPGAEKVRIPPELGEYSVATFAGGCFWCMEPPFERLDGVAEVISGYTGGPEKDPSYREVAYGKTGHTESVRVFFDPDQIGYEDLLAVYWRQIDPTDREGQFVDRGAQYRPEIFVHSERQRELAAEAKRSLAASGRFEEPIVVPITDAGAFYPAEEYHQDFYRTNPRRYEGYVKGSGRKDFLAEKWPGEETGGSR